MTPFETIVKIYWFCGNQIYRTGQGAPELDVYISTIMSADTSGKIPEERLGVIRRRIEEAIAHYKEHLENAAGQWWFTNFHRVEDERKLAAYQDLGRRIEQEDWTLPEQMIPPVIYTVSVKPNNKEQLQAFAAACYRAIVFDLRLTHQQSWKTEEIRREPIRSYADISRDEHACERIIRRVQDLGHDEKIALLFAQDDSLLPHPLIEQLMAAGYEILPLL